MAWVTGKFVLETAETEDGDKALHIAVELLPDITPDAAMASAIAESIPHPAIAFE